MVHDVATCHDGCVLYPFPRRHRRRAHPQCDKKYFHSWMRSHCHITWYDYRYITMSSSLTPAIHILSTDSIMHPSSLKVLDLLKIQCSHYTIEMFLPHVRAKWRRMSDRAPTTFSHTRLVVLSAFFVFFVVALVIFDSRHSLPSFLLVVLFPS